jgi:type II secretory pathway pseudopilin PulG
LRVTDLLALKGAEPVPSPERNPLAYFLALFVPGGQTAPPANALILIVVIGLLAAMAIPAFQKVRQASITMTCVNNLRQLDAAAEQYSLENGKAPTELSNIVGSGKAVARMSLCPAGGEYRLVPGDNPESAQVVCSVHESLEDAQRRLRGSRHQ